MKVDGDKRKPLSLSTFTQASEGNREGVWREKERQRDTEAKRHYSQYMRGVSSKKRYNLKKKKKKKHITIQKRWLILRNFYS